MDYWPNFLKSSCAHLMSPPKAKLDLIYQRPNSGGRLFFSGETPFRMLGEHGDCPELAAIRLPGTCWMLVADQTTLKHLDAHVDHQENIRVIPFPKERYLELLPLEDHYHTGALWLFRRLSPSCRHDEKSCIQIISGFLKGALLFDGASHGVCVITIQVSRVAWRDNWEAELANVSMMISDNIDDETLDADASAEADTEMDDEVEDDEVEADTGVDVLSDASLEVRQAS